ncbi:hypothetical protein B296_00005015 [Ensete ventricosum]|uniref:Uncharacterized protein n=1 Tax=Ensete ventricosum TaxID=4639 RepID=A0A426Z2L2_ENSVE|nr:hypothetical protein B296_00005015 [Ensete ventricosum]
MLLGREASSVVSNRGRLDSASSDPVEEGEAEAGRARGDAVGVFVTGPGNGCFETRDATGDFTRAVGRRWRLEPSDASSRTVQHASGYHLLCDPFSATHASMKQRSRLYRRGVDWRLWLHRKGVDKEVAVEEAATSVFGVVEAIAAMCEGEVERCRAGEFAIV